jgi:hypothetical protein
MLVAASPALHILLAAPPPIVRNNMVSMNALPDSPEGWRTVLSPNQFAVLREAAT